MKKKFQYVFVCFILVVIGVSFFIQIQEEKTELPQQEMESKTDNVIMQVELENTEKEDIYQEKMTLKRDDFFLLQVKKQSEKADIFDMDIFDNKGKLSIEIESAEYDENGICTLNVRVTSFIDKNMVFNYESRLKMFYLDSNLQIPSVATPQEVFASGIIDDDSNVNYVYLTPEGEYKLTDEIRTLCEILPGENYFSIRYDIGELYKNNEEYCWCLSSLSLPGVSQFMPQYWNTDYVIKIDFSN